MNSIQENAPEQGLKETSKGIAGKASLNGNAEQCNWKFLPDELKQRPQWCLANSNKAPSIIKGGSLIPINGNDPDNWLDFDAATKLAKERGLNIGFMLTADDPFTCIDLDVKDADNEPNVNKHTAPEQFERFTTIIGKFDSYTERSRSGKGWHVWCTGGSGSGVRRDGVEVYSQERFIICTGNATQDAKPISERSELVATLVAEIDKARRGSAERVALVEQPEDYSDAEIWERAANAANGEKFSALCDGEKESYPSQSEADLALLSILAFYSRSNKQCRRMFRETKLGEREKAVKNDVYLNRTLSLIRGRQAKEEAEAEELRKRCMSLNLRKPLNILTKPTPKPFDFDEVPKPIADLAYAFSQATGFDHSGVIVAATTAAASMIDDRYRLEVRRGSDWYASARQWVFLCASPSAGKSPVIRSVTEPIKRIHHELICQWKLHNEHLDDGDKQPLPALYTSDATVPALSEKLKDNPQGLLMLNEEFSSWIGGIDSSDKGESAKNRGDWLQLRDGGARQIDRISRGSVHVSNWGASVLAACTPDGITKQMKHMPEDGLIQRFVPCVMGQPDLDADGDCTSKLQNWEQWLRWVKVFTTGCAEQGAIVRFSEEARKLFEAEHREQRELTMATEEFAPAYAAHLGKHPGMLAEIALIFHVFSPSAPHAHEISAETMNFAIRYMRRVRKHAYHLYSSILSATPAFELARSLARSIVASDEVMTTIGRQWMTHHCAAFKKADDRTRREAVQILEDSDWLNVEPGAREYGGWPREFKVNEQVFQLFSREGKQWQARRKAVKEMIGDMG